MYKDERTQKKSMTGIMRMLYAWSACSSARPTVSFLIVGAEQ
ncbi:Dynein heavy chain [Giardia duodenalis]|uniref:Dynein heavy chain n=1 Tax=Giardia intestinalis TaxID=5741 RepID=V6U0Q5_GIAIN|nr:Dynein heavy chain [Giardia intestinalis]